MKSFVFAASAALSLLIAAPAVAATGAPMEQAGTRTSAEIKSAHVFVDRMPCAGTCVRKSVVTVTLKPGCYTNSKIRVVSVDGSTATLKVTVAKPQGPQLCPAAPKRLRVTVTGAIDSIVDASTGASVETSTSEAV